MAEQDIHFGMKKLSMGNWREPDVPKNFPGVTEEVWVSAVMKPKLIAAVPEEVVRLFEVARGSILYGWLFYPLLTLASEQLLRVQEAAVRERCKQAGVPLKQKKHPTQDRHFKDLIDDLSAKQIIPDDERPAWDAVRNLRNSASHPSRQSILPPGLALADIEVTARQINQLFTDNKSYFSRLGLRVRKATGLHNPNSLPVVAGIDVGASAKGFHLVALHGAAIAGTYHTTEPTDAVRWCQKVGAKLVAVDAPSGWRRGTDQSCREAEEKLRQSGYSSYPTPCREIADTNPAYAWMLNGERLYSALRSHYPLFSGETPAGSFCFETYPYVASCALAGRKLKAEDKGLDRRELIRAAGINNEPLQSIDHVDATICALVAFSVAIDYCEICGNSEEGFIVVPPLH
jgi:predicted nuclease with RNAse H fold